MRSVLIQQHLDHSLQHNPEKVAVTDGKDQYTYQETELLSNRLANCLRSIGVTRQDRVVFCMQRSVNCLIAMLGILKADAIYVPIDHKSPAGRLKKIIEDCKSRALICDMSTISKFSNDSSFPETNMPILSLNNKGQHAERTNTYFADDIYKFGDHQPQYENSDTDTAYILYTSGSTGKPKGVMISHRNINNYIDWATEFLNIKEDDKLLGTAPFHFDMSTFDIYCTLKSKATLCIAKDNLMLFPEMLMRYMEQEEVTIWKGISSLLMYIDRAGILGKDRIPTLKKILFGGESLPAKYLIRWMATYPEKHFYNAYGPTEATGISLCYPIPEIPKDPADRIPIGKPCKDTVVLLIKEDNSIAQAGEIGELCITGTCLSKGYLNDQEKTDQAFICNSFYAGCGDFIYKTGDLARLRPDGNYEFIDRKDNQVKFLGYRIELCEIEHALLSIDAIKDAAVQLRQSAHEGLTELVAFYESEEDISTARILAVLESHLP
ncbi:MAG: amino acid adenylation domain-containing protein, partial [Desulfobacteraceae bacterium]|nr:amino acid adenylation domain-containing protein [Desulfobacteraceae bacterium]